MAKGDKAGAMAGGPGGLFSSLPPGVLQAILGGAKGGVQGDNPMAPDMGRIMPMPSDIKGLSPGNQGPEGLAGAFTPIQLPGWQQGLKDFIGGGGFVPPGLQGKLLGGDRPGLAIGRPPLGVTGGQPPTMTGAQPPNMGRVINPLPGPVSSNGPTGGVGGENPMAPNPGTIGGMKPKQKKEY